MVFLLFKAFELPFALLDTAPGEKFLEKQRLAGSVWLIAFG
jgi:hypothetical protein